MKIIILVVTVLAASASAGPGLSYGFPEGRVVGGVDATPHQFPFIVSLQLKNTNTQKYVHNCGGSILNEWHVLTAGHCILPGEWEVVAGVHNLKKKESSEQRVKIAKSFVHPLYTGDVAPHDIAVIRVKTKFVLNKYVKAIALPAANSNPTGTGILAGWGSTTTGFFPKYPDILQTVQLPIISFATCRTVVSSPPLHRTNLCVGPVTGGKSSCGGDSGGPFISQGLKPTIIGTVSWGPYPCGNNPSVSVFVRVSDHLDFINQHING